MGCHFDRWGGRELRDRAVEPLCREGVPGKGRRISQKWIKGRRAEGGSRISAGEDYDADVFSSMHLCGSSVNRFLCGVVFGSRNGSWWRICWRAYRVCNVFVGVVFLDGVTAVCGIYRGSVRIRTDSEVLLEALWHPSG